jgi:D-amino-acid oxidase
VRRSDCEVLVVGAGVSGLTTAICLAEAGARVIILATAPPGRTTSAVAGAVWGPHLVEDSPRVARWGLETLGVLRELAADPATGVRTAAGVLGTRGVPPQPGAAGDVPAARPGWLAGLGAVACTGARDLLPDPALVPFRGQVVVAENPGLTEFFIGHPDDAAELVYLFPHGDTVVLGGTEVAGDWNTEPVPAVATRILRDCAAVEPRLAGARVAGHRVGLRPFRPQVRLEAEARGDGPLVVHNYGHGGAGITLSWGCAREAAALAAQALG